MCCTPWSNIEIRIFLKLWYILPVKNFLENVVFYYYYYYYNLHHHNHYHHSRIQQTKPYWWALSPGGAVLYDALYAQLFFEPQLFCSMKWGRVSNFCIYSVEFALKLRKKDGKVIQAIRKALGWPAPNAIRLVDLASAGNVLNLRHWVLRQAQGLTIGQRKYLPSCVSYVI